MRLLRRLARLWFSLLAATVTLLAVATLARSLLPRLPLLAPQIDLTSPEQGTLEVLPVSQVSLRFSQPMNRASVEHALRLTPTHPGQLLWPDSATLIFSPTLPFTPNTSYRLTLDSAATSWLYQDLEQNFALDFRTSPAPTVVNLLPANQATEVSPQMLLSIGFSRPMVSADLIGRDLALTEILIDPPVPSASQWLDQSTLLIRPLHGLAPATPYTVTVTDALRDMSGSTLGQSVRWHFSTAAPRLLGVAPAVGTRAVGLREPLVISLTQPVDLAALETALVISPIVRGQFAETRLSSDSAAAQLITFIPDGGWKPSTSYQVTLPAGVKPAQGSLPLAVGASWSFRSVDPPRLVGRFPGEGQTLAPDQDLRLAFNTPVDPEALAAALLLEPPVDGLAVRGGDGEVRIGGALRPSTAYTLTLPATLSDTNGSVLGSEYRLHFATAPVAPALNLPGIDSRFLPLIAGQNHQLAIERVNLSAIELALYDLDEATLVRTLSFSEQNWRDFTPERYGRGTPRRRSLQLADPLDTSTQSALNLSLLDNQPDLAPGAYYLRITSPEGPRVDLVIIVSRIALALVHDSEQVVVWATDTISRTTVPDLPLTLYQGDAVIARGRSDAQGLWQVAHRLLPGNQPAIVVTSGAEIAVVSSAWRGDSAAARGPQLRPSRYRGLLYTDRVGYRPGDELHARVLVRQVDGSSARWPANGVPLELVVRPVGGPPLYRVRLALRNGTAQTIFRLPDDAPVGNYLVQAGAGGMHLEAHVQVEPAAASHLMVALDAPARTVTGAELPLQARVTSPQGSPLAGVAIAWQLGCIDQERATNSPISDLPPESRFPKPPPATCASWQGSGLSDADGRLSFNLKLPAKAERYRLDVRAEELPGVAGTASTLIEAVPALRLEPALPSSIIASRTAFQVGVQARTADDRPAPAQVLDVTLLRRAVPLPGEQAPADAQVLRRRVTTGDDGRVTIELPGQLPGAYVLVTAAAGVVGSEARLPLWVTAPGFSAWSGDQTALGLVADRQGYLPSDVATLLPLLPADVGPTLLVRKRQDSLTAEVRTLRPGEPITLSLSADDAPSIIVSLLTLSAGTEPARLLSGSIELPVRADAAGLRLSIQSDRNVYLPGQTATLTVSVADTSGQPQAVDLALIATTATPGLANDAVQQAIGGMRPARPLIAQSLISAANATAAGVLQQPANAGSHSIPLPSPVSFGKTLTWEPELHTTNGQVTLQIKLPDTPALVKVAMLASADAVRWGQAEATLAVTQSIQMTPLLPTVLVVGDEVQLAVQVTNSAAVSQEVAVTLGAGGIVLRSGSELTRWLSLGPGAIALVGWVGSAGVPGEATVIYSAQLTDGNSIRSETRLPVRSNGYDEQRVGGGPAAPRFAASSLIPSQSSGPASLEIAVTPSLQGALLDLWRQLDREQARSNMLDADTLLATAALVRSGNLGVEALNEPLGRLVAAQQEDGGWGWWPGEASLPLVSTQVALALAAVEGPPIPAATVERAGDYLRRSLAVEKAPDLRAFLLAALTGLGQSDAGALRQLSLLPDQLQVDALATLALAAHQTGDTQVASRLVAVLAKRARPSADQIFWPLAANEQRPLNSLAASALALQAIKIIDPASTMIDPASRFLLGRYTLAGWGSSYTTARVIAALAERISNRDTDYRYVIALNGVELLNRSVSATMTETQHLVLDSTQLQPSNDLTVTRSGDEGLLMVGYHLRTSSIQPSPGGSLALQRSYLDPQSGAVLDPTTLKVGRLVVVRLTVVAPRNFGFVVLDEVLPACLDVLLPTLDRSPFGAARLEAGRLRAYAPTLPAGIYEYRYLARISYNGAFTAPAPVAYLAYEPSLRGQGIATRMLVEP